ncbi:hypothetical protein H8356DRAFT_1359643 [Neocallimastix lanati (nom. inval.)]|nr:hypothetical protein H8356DRAFT_1359643 [Neocallimastix sp. JGI-2020a]
MKNFMIFKNSNIIIFQSPFQIFFVDDTFKISPKCGYQVFITRTYVKELNSFYTTSFSILKNKEQRTYEQSRPFLTQERAMLLMIDTENRVVHLKCLRFPRNRMVAHLKLKFHYEGIYKYTCLLKFSHSKILENRNRWIITISTARAEFRTIVRNSTTSNYPIKKPKYLNKSIQG